MNIGKDSLISSQAIVAQPENIHGGNNVQIKPTVVLRPETGFIYIGNNVTINHYTVIHAKGGVEIGDWTIIGPHCRIRAQRQDKIAVPISELFRSNWQENCLRNS